MILHHHDHHSMINISHMIMMMLQHPDHDVVLETRSSQCLHLIAMVTEQIHVPHWIEPMLSNIPVLLI